MIKDLRRLFVATSLALLSSCAAPNPLSVPQSSTRRPTDPALLPTSLLEQFSEAHLGRPTNFQLFPKNYDRGRWPKWVAEGFANVDTIPQEQREFDRGPFMSIQSTGFTSVTGEADDHLIVDDSKKSFDIVFLSQVSCRYLSVDREVMEWRRMAALHESTHYASFKLVLNGLDLNDRVYVALTHKSPPRETFTEHDELPKTGASTAKNLDVAGGELPHFNFMDAVFHFFPGNYLERAFLHPVTLVQVRERIADTGGTLYELSNGNDVQSTEKFLGRLIDYRNTNYTDSDHNTASSISAAIRAFHARPVYGLSIVATAQWAASIIANQPELQSGRTDLLTRFPRLSPMQPGPDPTVLSSLEGMMKFAANKTLEARQRACQFYASAAP